MKKESPFAGLDRTSSSTTEFRPANPPPFAVTLTNPDGSVLKTSVMSEAADKITAVLDKLGGKQRRHVIRELRDQVRRGPLSANIDDLLKRHDHMPPEKSILDPPLRGDLEKTADDIAKCELGLAVLRDLDGWGVVAPGLVLERAQASRAHALLEAARNGGLVLLEIDKATKVGRAQLTDADVEIGQVFVVEHDWASAFNGAQDYGGADFRLPYDRCCFEFRLSGRHVFVLAGQSESGDVQVSAIVELKMGRNTWLLAAGGSTPDKKTPEIDGLWQPLKRATLGQIKAICVALEAEVAEVDAPRIVSTPDASVRESCRCSITTSFACIDDQERGRSRATMVNRGTASAFISAAGIGATTKCIALGSNGCWSEIRTLAGSRRITGCEKVEPQRNNNEKAFRGRLRAQASRPRIPVPDRQGESRHAHLHEAR